MLTTLTHHRQSLIASRGTAWVVLALVVCLASTTTQANAALMIYDYSESAVKLAMPADQLLGWIDVGGDQTAAGGCGSSAPNDQFLPERPAGPSPAGAFQWMDLAKGGCSTGGGMGGTSTFSGGGVSAAFANLCGSVSDLPVLLSVSWLYTGQFLFIPPAPSSELLRPPQTFMYSA